MDNGTCECGCGQETTVARVTDRAKPRTEWSNIDHRYRRVLSDWRELCSRCHRYYDHDVLGVYNPCIEQAA